MRTTIPDKGRSQDEVLEQLETFRADDIDWRGGKVFSLVYHAGEEHERFLSRAHALYSSANGLNPMAFPSLRKMEADVVDMAADLFHAPPTAVGAMSSGGTESILLAMYTYREKARRERRMLRDPEVVVPVTAHPAFDKAAHYFDIKLRKVPVTAEFLANPKKMARAINRRTIAMVGSAPQYPHGVIDPIGELGEVASRAGVPLHVDACVGGFILPWIERLGRPLPEWDFRVPGVTSISADLHKYGYAGKGASVLVWRSMEFMRHQFAIFTDWPGGIYASPVVVGTRPGGPFATAWATLQSIGADGYLEMARRAVEAADRLREGIGKIEGLRVMGNSVATVVTWGAAEGGPDVYAVADRIQARGWAVDRQQRPACVHLTVTQNHLPIVDAYLADLRAAVDEVRANPELKKSGLAPTYGLMAKVPMRGMVAESVRKVMAQTYAPGATGMDVASAGKGEGLVDRMVEKYGSRATELLDRVEQTRTRLRRKLGRD